MILTQLKTEMSGLETELLLLRPNRSARSVFVFVISVVNQMPNGPETSFRIGFINARGTRRRPGALLLFEMGPGLRGCCLWLGRAPAAPGTVGRLNSERLGFGRSVDYDSQVSFPVMP